jgi:hypothetical protein
MSKHRYTVNQTRMPLCRIFRMGLSCLPLTEIGQLERNHRDFGPWIELCSLTFRGIIRQVGRVAIRNVCQTIVTFHPHSWSSPAPPRRAGDTTRSALGEGG